MGIGGAAMICMNDEGRTPQKKLKIWKSVPKIGRWVHHRQDYNAGDVEAFVKSEPVPESQGKQKCTHYVTSYDLIG